MVETGFARKSVNGAETVIGAGTKNRIAPATATASGTKTAVDPETRTGIATASENESGKGMTVNGIEILSRTVAASGHARGIALATEGGHAGLKLTTAPAVARTAAQNQLHAHMTRANGTR